MSSGPELIRRSVEPEVLEFPLETLDGLVTPNELFFVRNHYPTPTVDASTCQLSIATVMQPSVTHRQRQTGYDGSAPDIAGRSFRFATAVMMSWMNPPIRAMCS